MNQIKEKKCIVCGREFKYNTERGNYGMRGKGKRRKEKSQACSPKCSKIYNRISQHVHSKWIPKKFVPKQ
jgi:predicted nucleic acid-binding Zn ribbon protein